MASKQPTSPNLSVITQEQVAQLTRAMGSKRLRAYQTELSSVSNALTRLERDEIGALLNYDERDVLRAAVAIVKNINTKITVAKEKKQREEKRKEARAKARNSEARTLVKKYIQLPEAPLDLIVEAMALQRAGLFEFYSSTQYSLELCKAALDLPKKRAYWTLANEIKRLREDLVEAVQQHVADPFGTSVLQENLQTLQSQCDAQRKKVLDEEGKTLKCWAEAIASEAQLPGGELMDRQRILEKVAKCFALAQSTGASANEAETALRQARNLMKQFNLDERDVEASLASDSVVSTGTRRSPGTWLHGLALACADAFDCEYLAFQQTWESWAFKFVGVGVSAELASYAYSALHHQLQLARREHVAQQKRCKLSTKRRRGQIFAEAWVYAVGSTVRAFASEQPPEQRKAITAYLALHHPEVETVETQSTRIKGNDNRSAEAGWLKGQNASLHRAVGNNREHPALGGGK